MLVAAYVILLSKHGDGGDMSPRPITENTLFYGDNLIILREHIPGESVDLVYFDPPFRSNRSNKDLRLLAHEDSSYVWMVDLGNYRVAKVRLPYNVATQPSDCNTHS